MTTPLPTDYKRNVVWAETVKRYWRNKGHVVDVRLEVSGNGSSGFTRIRSSLVNGAPQQTPTKE